MILVLSGPKRSGKDEVANILKKHHNYQRVGLADPLKRLCSTLLGLPLEYFFDDSLKDRDLSQPIIVTYDILDKLAELVDANEIERALLYQHGRNLTFYSPRDIMQKVGTDLVRVCVRDSYWLDIAIPLIQSMEGNIIITDARLPNERAILKAIGGTLVRIKRKGYEGSGHVSETSIGDDSEYDVIINNSGTLTELQHDVLMWHTMRFSNG